MDVIYRKIQLVNNLPEESLYRLKNIEASDDKKQIFTVTHAICWNKYGIESEVVVCTQEK
jgi:hypothetical protein